jgi:hypothetical protein
MLLHGMHLVRDAEATHVTVACLGAPGHPEARELYYRVGFRPFTRDAPLIKPAVQCCNRFWFSRPVGGGVVSCLPVGRRVGARSSGICGTAVPAEAYYRARHGHLPRAAISGIIIVDMQRVVNVLHVHANLSRVRRGRVRQLGRADWRHQAASSFVASSVHKKSSPKQGPRASVLFICRSTRTENGGLSHNARRRSSV